MNGTLDLAEDKVIAMLIAASITAIKRCGEKCGRKKVFDLIRSSLNSDIIRDTFDELLQDMIESNTVKLRTIRERKCLLKEEPKDLDMTTNKKLIILFSITACKIQSSLNDQFSSFKQSFIA